ncbi:MAG: peptidoglycan DD-metalloendopeptidase family protein [Chloroflexi bacterium]|nr:peptidoglycan DD-metalloendopeptidase family protein [Chloroflexota bacterium]
MAKQKDSWQRFSGYLVLVAGILLLFLAGQLFEVGNRSADETVTVPALSTNTPDGLSISSPVTETVQLDTAASTFPLSVHHDTSLAPAPNPRTYQAKMPTHNFQIHIVTDLDTPNSIADQYGISADTLIGGNSNINRESNLLQNGTELIILPVDGILHIVRPGETIESIADLYDVTAEDIIGYQLNNLEYPFLRLIPESQLVIPGATIGQFYFKAPKSVGNSGEAQEWTVVGTGSYIWPVNGRCLTQFYSGFHPGIDVSMAEGSPVYAADTGTVTYAVYAAGVYFDYGNLIVINHGNSFETFYAHLSGINVYPGQIVYQGDLIGSTGNTGRSSGPHLHMEIRNNDYRTNPLDRLGGAVRSCN